MLLRQLKYFLAVADTDSFTEAAAQCFISQSAISQQIQTLERELGVKLLRRENRKFTLTEAGKYFYQKGRLLADEAEQLCRETLKVGRESSPRRYRTSSSYPPAAGREVDSTDLLCFLES